MIRPDILNRLRVDRGSEISLYYQNYPLIEEYDLKRDKTTPDLKIELKSTT